MGLGGTATRQAIITLSGVGQVEGRKLIAVWVGGMRGVKEALGFGGLCLPCSPQAPGLFPSQMSLACPLRG